MKCTHSFSLYHVSWQQWLVSMGWLQRLRADHLGHLGDKGLRATSHLSVTLPTDQYLLDVCQAHINRPTVLQASVHVHVQHNDVQILKLDYPLPLPLSFLPSLSPHLQYMYTSLFLYPSFCPSSSIPPSVPLPLSFLSSLSPPTCTLLSFPLSLLPSLPPSLPLLLSPPYLHVGHYPSTPPSTSIPASLPFPLPLALLPYILPISLLFPLSVLPFPSFQRHCFVTVPFFKLLSLSLTHTHTHTH